MDKPHAKPEHPREHPEGELQPPLDAAKRSARQRIADDRRGYPQDLGPVFDALAARLFEPGFSAKEVVPDPAAERRFRIAVGVTPRAYRDRQLLETALELVRETTLPILEIAAGLGFDDPELFTKWFKWRVGEAPTSMRPPDGEPQDSPPSPAAADKPWTDRECRRAAAWGAGPQRGAAMIRRIRELYPELDDPTSSD